MRIFHLEVPADIGSLKDWLDQWLKEQKPELMSFPNASELITFGAIYLNELRVLQDQGLQKGDKLRVHVDPKRYHSGVLSWHQRIRFEDADMLVVDKPSGIPVHATLDNVQENLVAQLSQYFQIPLFCTHRLDICTSGLVILAKSPETQKKIQRQFTAGRIHRRYWALTKNALAPGLLLDWMLKSSRAPRVSGPSQSPLSLRCEAMLHQCLPYRGFYLLELDLVTGRTHQIRFQLSERGANILGDSLYDGSELLEHPNEIALRAHQIQIRDQLTGQNLSLSTGDESFKWANQWIEKELTYGSEEIAPNPLSF